MTDLREAVARLVDPKLFDDHAPHPWPYLLDEERNAAISVAGDYLRAIEAAGYVIAQQVDEIDFDENDRSFVVKSFLVEKGAVDAMVAAASPPLAKET